MKARKALIAADKALDGWVRSYAPELCLSKYLQESSERVYDAGGTLAYIASVKSLIKDGLRELRKRGRGSKAWK